MSVSPPHHRNAELQAQAVERLLASQHFAKAPLLSAFLRYILDRLHQPELGRVTEQEIGVRVFHRRPDYEPGEDNIVRNYARQLRRRLESYYEHEGKDEPLRIDIPRGGYVPVFIPKGQEPEAESNPAEAGSSHADAAHDAPKRSMPPRPALSWPQRLLWMGGGLILMAAIGFTVWLRLPHTPLVDTNVAGLDAFWREIFARGKNTSIVPADTGFVMIQEMDRRTYSLAEYESWPSIEQYNHVYTSYLRAQRYTSVLDLRLVEWLDHRPEAASSRVSIRSARDFKIEDMSDGSTILLGSIYSNPWIEVFQNRLNFHFVYSPAGNSSSIVNLHPLPGEQPNYGSAWTSYSHKTYAVLAFLPNLNHTGHVLLIQGLDGAGTEAAANLLLSPDEFRPILEQARQRDGSFRSFEVLIDATSVDSHATGPHILSLRLMEN